jgi:hypothetical protein
MWTRIVLLEDWMMNDCRGHLSANSKQQTANSQSVGSRREAGGSRQKIRFSISHLSMVIFHCDCLNLGVINDRL